jgi:hypothetical protein
MPTLRASVDNIVVENGAYVILATFILPDAYMNFDGAGMDYQLGTRAFAGIFASHRNLSSPLGAIHLVVVPKETHFVHRIFIRFV